MCFPVINIKSKSTRILFALSAVSTYLLYVHYTAYLTAASTHVKTSSINSFEDVITGGYKVLVQENTAEHDILKLAKPGTPTHKVYYKTMNNNPHAFVQSPEEVLNKLQSQKTLFYGPKIIYVGINGLKFLDIQGLLVSELLLSGNIFFLTGLKLTLHLVEQNML